MTEQELERMRAGTLPPREIAAIGQHLSSCGACAGTVSRVLSLPRKLNDLRIQMEADAEFHLADDEITMWVDGELTGDRLDAVRMHLESCEICSRDVSELRAIQVTVPITGHRRWVSLLLAASLGAVLFAGIFVVVRRWADTKSDPVSRREPAPPSVAEPSTHAPPTVVEQARSYGREDWDRLVATAIRTGTLEMPALLMELRSTPATARGETDSTDFALRPNGIVIPEDRPRFQWRAEKGARYRVVLALDQDDIVESDILLAPYWQQPRALKRGREYSWQIEVIQGDERTIYPKAPMPPARFQILDAASVAEIDDAQRRFPEDHLLHAVLMARHGLAYEAEQQLLKAKREGQSESADALLRSLRSWPAFADRARAGR